MCGISVWCQKDDVIDKKQFQEMNNLVKHRGPDDEGYYYDAGLAMGHRRLSIIDVSEKGHQPFLYKSKYALVFNGEIYNYIELRAKLENKGYQFQTDTDTEVLIAMYDYYGNQCVNWFNGMWAFVIYDKERDVLFGSRDRFGVKPLYYYYQKGELLLASEIKQILHIKKECAKVNKTVMQRYLVFGDLDYTDDTFFKDIYKIPAGSCFEYRLKNQKLNIYSYYKLDYLKKSGKYYKKYYMACNDFKTNFRNSVNLRLRADVKVGYCLSGGLDSSAIVCMVDKILQKTSDKEEQHTISSCSEDKRYDEQEYIDAVIKQTNFVSHKIFPSNDNLFYELDKIIWHMDEPFGSTSIYAQWNVFKEAHKHGLKVMIDGQGADEQLAGYTSFYKVLFCYYLRHMKIRKFYREWRYYKELRHSTEKYIKLPSVLYLLAVAYLSPSIVWKIEHKIKKINSPFLDEVVEKCEKVRSNIFCIGKCEQFFMDHIYMGLQSLLHYEDRNSMAFSIESRVPFLDINVADCLSEMPIDYKIREGRTKAVMRDALRAILPQKIYNRYSKLGFVTPEDQWITNNMDIYRAELEKACDNLKGLVDKKRVLRWFDQEGIIKRGDFTIWRIICAGHWMEVFHVDVN